MDPIARIIHDLLLAHGNCDPRDLPASTRLADLDIDSLTMVEMTIQLERKLGIQIPEDRVDGIITLGDLSGLIEERVAARDAISIAV